jgi:hypothetical protein
LSLQIYILGVEARFRGKQLLQKIKDDGYSCKIVWGQDAQDRPTGLSIFFRNLSKVVNKREISVGEYCCAIGHQRIMKSFLDSGQSWGLILEEDANILDDISTIEALTKDKNGATILHLAGIDHILRSTREETFWLRDAHAEMVENEEVVLFRVVGNVFGAFGFLINREAAEIAVAGNNRLRFPQLADWPSTWRYKVKFLITDKAFVSVDTNGSELVKDRNKLLNSSLNSNKSKVILKLHGWFKLLLNVFLIEPTLKSLFGISFRSVIHENLYLYLNSRLLIRLRKSPIDVGKDK